MDSFSQQTLPTQTDRRWWWWFYSRTEEWRMYKTVQTCCKALDRREWIGKPHVCVRRDVLEPPVWLGTTLRRLVILLQ